MRRFMVKNGFVYSQRKNHYTYTKERSDAVLMRVDYLDWVRKYRRDGYRIFWQDETWVFKHMAQSKVWQTAHVASERDVDYRVPSSRRTRSIVYHLGSKETGLLEGCLLLFTGQKSSDPDYNSEMNSEVFLKWFEETVFPKMKEGGQKCVFVLDRANYRNEIIYLKTPRCPGQLLYVSTTTGK